MRGVTRNEPVYLTVTVTQSPLDVSVQGNTWRKRHVPFVRHKDRPTDHCEIELNIPVYTCRPVSKESHHGRERFYRG